MSPRVEKPADPEEQLSAGQDFVRRIGPAGCVLFLALALLVGALCLTAGRDPIGDYTPPQDTAYYAAHPAELVAELEESVFPKLDKYTLSAAVTPEGKVAVTETGDYFVAARSAILWYFDESLFTFIDE